MRHVAICSAAGVVEQIIVVPDVADPVAYARGLGLTGTLVACNDPRTTVGHQHVDGAIYPVWRQVFGAGDDPLEVGQTGYPATTEVYHNGKVWVSTTDVNVWEPGVSGWQEKAGQTALPPWRQPTGAHDAYALGAEVSHEGSNWRSLVAANVWMPGTPGLWSEIV